MDETMYEKMSDTPYFRTEPEDARHEPTNVEIEAEYERMVADHEQETGRCYYCHRPIRQCVCDDGDWEEFGDFYGITEDDL